MSYKIRLQGQGKGKDDKDFAPPAPCPPWRYWPIALPDRDRAMGVQEVGQGVARIEHAENRVPAPKAKHSTRTQRAAERARADARSWLTRVDQFNREMSDLQQALSDDSEGTSSWIEAGRDRVSLASVSEGTSCSIEAGRDRVSLARVGKWGQRICQLVGRWVSQ